VLIVVGLVILFGLVVFIGIYFGVVKKEGDNKRAKYISYTPASLPLTSLAAASRFDFFSEAITANRTLATLRHLSSAPHLAGTIEDYETAIYVKSKSVLSPLDRQTLASCPFGPRLEEYGFTAHIHQVSVLLSYPLHRVVELVSPDYYNCTMQELPVAADPTSSDPRAVPTFNGFSASGDVTGDLVYVNYGTRDDFLHLDSLGVSLNGTIVIVRYGKIFRANKCKQAEERGAIGCLIYSDPQDDGYVKGDGTLLTISGPGSRQTLNFALLDAFFFFVFFAFSLPKGTLETRF